MVKLNTLEKTKRLYPHFFDKEDDSNFSKHLSLINNHQQDIRHKLKAIEWSRLLEKPLQLWKTQTEPYKYRMDYFVNVPYLQEVNIYRNPIINGEDEIVGYDEIVFQKTFDDDKVSRLEHFSEHEMPLTLTISHDDELLWYYNKYEPPTNDEEEANIYPNGKYEAYTDLISEDRTLNFTIKPHGHIDENNNNETFSFKYTLRILNDRNETIAEQPLMLISDEGEYVHEATFTSGNLTITVNGNETLNTAIGTGNWRFEVSVEGITDESFIDNITVSDSHELYDETIPNPTKMPRDTFLLEVKTWDDYRFIKGYPENDYTSKEDNTLKYQYNTTFLDISLEEISYTKYLTFRVHKDKIKKIRILKNDVDYFTQEFDTDLISQGKPTSYSHYYYTSGENGGVLTNYYEVEADGTDNIKKYFTEEDIDEYVYRMKLTDDDFNEDGIVKDTFDLVVNTYEKRYHCRHDYEKVYSKRYNGYDEKQNDCFDHDYSLDTIGALLNVPRYEFYQVYNDDEKHLSHTYPTYYDRATEDDHSYMKRMQYYISHYNKTPFPVLEFWKYYQVMPRLRSRKRIIGEMDESTLRANDDLICDSDFLSSLEEKDTDEQVTMYSVNKATVLEGESTQITKGDTTWHEAIIVKDVYIVPSADYRLRYGTPKTLTDDVTVRLLSYNREGGLLRSTPIPATENYEPTDLYNENNDYNYTDIIFNIKEDTSSVKVVLESNSEFSFIDVTFERMTIVEYNNKYMTTTEDYNSNFYELYCDYEEIPTNIRIGGGERFQILFKRSLPLTKKGLLYVDINDDFSDSVNINTSWEAYTSNILLTEYRTGTVSDGNPYIAPVQNNLITGNSEYRLDIKFHMDSQQFEDYIEDADSSTDWETYKPNYQENELLMVEIYCYDTQSNVDSIIQLDDEAYSDTQTHLTYHFTTPDINLHHISIRIQSETDTTLEEVRLNRTDEITHLIT